MMRRYNNSRTDNSLSSGGSGYLTPDEAAPEEETVTDNNNNNNNNNSIVSRRSVRFFPVISGQSGFMAGEENNSQNNDLSSSTDGLSSAVIVIPDNSDTLVENNKDNNAAVPGNTSRDEDDDNDNFEDAFDPFSSQGQAIIDKKKWRIKRKKLGNGLTGRCFRRFPRCYALVCGVIIPLWFLLFLAWLGGYFLAFFEFDIELAANDAHMISRTVAGRFEMSLADTVNSLPTLCYSLFHSGRPADTISDAYNEILYERGNVSEYAEELVGNFTGKVTIDLFEFGAYLEQCGDAADAYGRQLKAFWYSNFSTSEESSTSLSFNWIRCVNTSLFDPEDFNFLLYPDWEHVWAARPENQSLAFSDTWSRQQEALEAEYLQSYLDMEVNLFDARVMALNDSLHEASGRDACAKNLPATAWFWFTVMTTVGYGNQTTESVAGRSLVYILGFISILFFGGILASTGTIVSHLVGDFFARLRLKFFTYKSVMMVMWCLMWLAWQVGLMFFFWWFNKIRVGSDIRWEDAYWWAFISTTTIGLGDFYPTPALIFTSDLLMLTPGFLIGFVLLSSFLAELGNLLAQFRPDMSEELFKRLQYVGILPQFCRCCLNLTGIRDMTLGHQEVNEETSHGAESSLDNEGTEKESKIYEHVKESATGNAEESVLQH